jgi:hypothetical protein
VLGSGGSGHGGHQCRGGPIGGDGEGNGSPQRQLHSGAGRVGWSTGEGPNERRRLELELSASNMGTWQSSLHGRLGRGTAGGAGSTVWCSHGQGERRRLYFGDFLRGRHGARQLNARGLLGEVSPETRERLLRWPARRTMTWRMSSSGVAGEECMMQRRDGDGNRKAQRRGKNKTGLSVGSNSRATHMAVAA